jgi:hypothetical protein
LYCYVNNICLVATYVQKDVKLVRCRIYKNKIYAFNILLPLYFNTDAAVDSNSNILLCHVNSREAKELAYGRSLVHLSTFSWLKQYRKRHLKISSTRKARKWSFDDSSGGTTYQHQNKDNVIFDWRHREILQQCTQLYVDKI